MPVLIKHIDAIARQKNRDVIYVRFDSIKTLDFLFSGEEELWFYENLKQRKILIRWFKYHNIKWEPCADFASENIMNAYCGQIYIDIEYNEYESIYQKFDNFITKLHYKYKNVYCYLVKIEDALKNSEHDRPGFWEDWAKIF